MTTLSIENFLSFLKTGLESLAIKPNQLIRIKEIRLLDQNVVLCEFYPYSLTSAELLLETGFVVSVIYSFFDGNSQAPPEINKIATKAFSVNNEELYYSLSSFKAAAFIANGDAIEWVKNSIINDMADDAKQLRAKRRISSIENALRHTVVEIMSSSKGTTWWTNVLTNKSRGDAEAAYKREHKQVSNDGSELIDYTYLSDLKTIVLDNWVDFAHIFHDRSQFELWMTDLNKIRRDESHNRKISATTILNLEALYTNLMGCIAKVYPSLIPSYLIEYWRSQIIIILDDCNNSQERIASGQPLDLAIKVVEQHIQCYKNSEIRIQSLLIPPGKEEIHAGLVDTIVGLRASFEGLMLAVRSGNFQEIELAQEKNEQARAAMKVHSGKFILSMTEI